jgi:hypothetical protein
MVPCKTWDNATLFCLVDHPHEAYDFPMTIKTYRIAPGEIDTWYLEVIGTEFSVRYSTKYPKTLQTMHYENGGKQEWRSEDLGYTSMFNTITGGIFEFGFTDAMLQMWAWKSWPTQLSTKILGALHHKKHLRSTTSSPQR